MMMVMVMTWMMKVVCCRVQDGEEAVLAMVTPVAVIPVI
jgi:hypothetical protein